MTFQSFPKPRPRLVTREAAKAAHEREAKQVRAKTRDDDGWRCCVCGRSVFLDAPPARRAETHHIVPRSLAPERINDPENLLTVCGSDHRKLTSHELAIVGTSRAAYRVVRGPLFRPGR